MSKKSKKPGLSKKDRRKLEEREAHLAAELALREKLAKKKAAKKGKGKKAAPAAPVKKSKKGKPAKGIDFEKLAAETEGMSFTATPEAPIVPSPPAPEESEEPTPEAIIAAAEKVLADENASKGARKSAEAALAKVAAKAKADLETDEEIRARVQAKRAERAAKAPAEGIKAARKSDALDGESEVDYQIRKRAERDAVSDAEVVAVVADAVEVLKSAVEEVETEHGRVFAAGESVAADAPEEFAKPSEAGPLLEEGRNGYKIIMLGADGKPDPRKVRQLTRVTTFVGNIDDDTTLRNWEKRLLAEGVSLNAEEYVPRVNDLVHRRDVAIAKAVKADRKGKLGIGELADLTEAASKAYRDAANALVEEALEAAGRNDKANAGTNLHTLAEISDLKGIDAVREMHEREEISASDLASIEAYAERMTRLKAKVIEVEAVIVNDEMGYAGRLDRIIMAKLPELTVNGVVRPADVRARRYVTDIKSGRIDLGAGKIARQEAAYALGDLYNLETGERTRHSAARDVALVFHLPQGAGTCAVYAVDIKTGAALLKLSAEVRRGRNTGRKTIDMSVDITDAAAE